MTELKGRLFYTGWLNRPWRLVNDDGETDLYPLVDVAFTAWNSKAVSHDYDKDGYKISLDPASSFDLVYECDERVILDKRGEFGFSNVHAYLEDALHRINGRLITMSIDEQGISFEADPSEEVFGLHFTDANSCAVPDGAEKTVCKVGEEDCCIFLTCGPGGFSCEKFSGSTARLLLGRHAKGEMRATRIGNCALLGRAENST